MSETSRLAHSEQYFTEERDHWFNPDFLDLMAKRWGLARFTSLLDVGAGLCHWSRLLAPYLAAGSRVAALDNDEKWAQGNAEIERFFRQKNTRIEFVKGTAYALPFADDSFDVVTCQTLLIHLKNPELALREMKRVVKKGGIVICSEPNNRIQSLLQDTSNQDDNIEEVLQRVKQNLAYEKYKQQQHKGNDSFGDLLTGAMNNLEFSNIQAYLNDKLVGIYPPYESPEQQAKINFFLKWGKSESEIRAFDEAYRAAVLSKGYPYFLKKYKPLQNESRIVRSLQNQTYSSGGAALLYLISGRK